MSGFSLKEKNSRGQRMRVLVVYQSLAHYRAAVFLEMARNGTHDYTFAAEAFDPNSPDIKPWQRPDDVKFVRLPTIRLPKGSLWQRKLIGLSLSRRFDAMIVLGHFGFPTFWFAALFGRLTGKRVLFWSHGWIRPDRGIKKLVRSSFYRLAHGMLLYGHCAKCIGVAGGFKPERLHVIYNSLDFAEQTRMRESITPSHIAETRTQIAGDANTPIIICSTRLTAVRRLDLLIDAARSLIDRGRRIHLLLVGDGPERSKLEAQARSMNVPTTFYGACYDEAVLCRLTMASNVTVAPGKVGLTAMQSLAYGTPVVTHGDAFEQMPEFEAVVDGVTGSLFEHNNLDSLTAAIDRWIAEPVLSGATRQACIDIIATRWNASVQRKLIERALAGEEANDLRLP
jgi:1,2-diacylglycerol 3-alpha-glucosyltransferase